MNRARRVQSGWSDRNTKWMLLTLPLCFQMDRCQQRLEKGLPPCPEIEEEWRRMLQDKKRRQRDKEDRDRVKTSHRHTQRSLVRSWLKHWGVRKEDRMTKKKGVEWGHDAGQESILRNQRASVYMNMHRVETHYTPWHKTRSRTCLHKQTHIQYRSLYVCLPYVSTVSETSPAVYSLLVVIFVCIFSPSLFLLIAAGPKGHRNTQLAQCQT